MFSISISASINYLYISMGVRSETLNIESCKINEYIIKFSSKEFSYKTLSCFSEIGGQSFSNNSRARNAQIKVSSFMLDYISRM